MDQMEKVYVTNVIDPLMFWARFGYDVDLLAEKHMEELISEYVSENSCLTEVDDLVLTQNQVIIARSNEYNCWLRATVVADVSSCSCSEVDVVFTGYGSNELVTWKDIITSVPDYVLGWDRSAECFELDGIEASGDIWSEEAVGCFTSLVVGRMLPCKRIVLGNPDAPGRLVIYSGDDRLQTIQDLLIDRGFAKWTTDGNGNSKQMISYVYPFTSLSNLAASMSVGIPEFNAQSLFFKSDSPPLPPSELPERDFEMEERRKFISSSMYEFPTRTDDVYLGLRPSRPSEVESFDEKIESIREEIARMGGRQLVRPNVGYLQRSYAQSPKLPKSDWRSACASPHKAPQRVHQASPPSAKRKNKGVSFESMSFKVSLQRLLTKKRDLDAIRDYLQPILDEDNLQHDRLFLCISTIVDHQLKVGNGVELNFQVLEFLKEKNGFSNCLGNLIQQIDKSYLQIVCTPSTEINAKLKPFAEFLAQLILRFHGICDVVDRVVSVADNWLQCCNGIGVNDRLCEVCATCLKHFICHLASQSIDLFKEKTEHLMIETKEKLFCDHTSRAVKEILLKLLLNVEQMKAKDELMKEIISQREFSPNLAGGDCVCNGSVSSGFSNSIERLISSDSEPVPDANAVKSHSASSLNDGIISPTAKATKSMLNVLKESSPNTDDAKITPRQKNRKKNKTKMSLSQYHASILDVPMASSDGCEKTSNGRSSAHSFDGSPLMDLICVLCGTKDDHDSASCPDRINKFFL